MSVEGAARGMLECASFETPLFPSLEVGRVLLPVDGTACWMTAPAVLPDATKFPAVE
jgi:hypothetical protein